MQEFLEWYNVTLLVFYYALETMTKIYDCMV